jgi:hypothetical protein
MPTVSVLHKIKWRFVVATAIAGIFDVLALVIMMFVFQGSVADLDAEIYGSVVGVAQQNSAFVGLDFDMSSYPQVVAVLASLVLVRITDALQRLFFSRIGKDEKKIMARFARYGYSLSADNDWIAISATGNENRLVDWNDVLDFISDVEDSHASNAAHHLNTDTHSPVA